MCVSTRQRYLCLSHKGDIHKVLQICDTIIYIPADELKLFSCYSLRAKAVVLLYGTRKDGLYIKLRLRWLSEFFQIYLKRKQRGFVSRIMQH